MTLWVPSVSNLFIYLFIYIIIILFMSFVCVPKPLKPKHTKPQFHYENLPMKYTEKISALKIQNFQLKKK